MASVRANYPMMFNTTVIPFPTTYSEQSQTIENVNQTEAGTDIVNVMRHNKLSASMTFRCLQSVLQTLASFETSNSFTFKRYNPKNGTYEERTVRMRGFTHELVKGSEDLPSVDGVWEVSFTLEEF